MSAIVLDSSQLLATIRDSLRCQLLTKLSVELTDKQARDIAANIAQAVMGLEVDDTHVIDAPVYRHDITPDPSNGGLYACSCGIRWMSLEQAEKHRRITHHDRCMSPFDDGHLTRVS